MLRKKISISLKKKIKKRGRPPKSKKKEPEPKVYSLIMANENPKIHDINIIVRLKLGVSTIKKIENDLAQNNDSLISNEFNETPLLASNDIKTTTRRSNTVKNNSRPISSRSS